eukprot:scaffold34918_cov29-Tisochrysis_lutea.AAC.3
MPLYKALLRECRSDLRLIQPTASQPNDIVDGRPYRAAVDACSEFASERPANEGTNRATTSSEGCLSQLNRSPHLPRHPRQLRCCQWIFRCPWRKCAR